MVARQAGRRSAPPGLCAAGWAAAKETRVFVRIGREMKGRWTEESSFGVPAQG